MGRQKILDWVIAPFPKFNLLLISSWMSFWFVSVICQLLLLINLIIFLNTVWVQNQLFSSFLTQACNNAPTSQTPFITDSGTSLNTLNGLLQNFLGLHYFGVCWHECTFFVCLIWVLCSMAFFTKSLCSPIWTSTPNSSLFLLKYQYRGLPSSCLLCFVAEDGLVYATGRELDKEGLLKIYNVFRVLE
jgi:hypothetical protein